MAVSDPLVAGWVQADAPALAVVAPALVALFVLVGGERADATVARLATSQSAPLQSAPSPRRRVVAASGAAVPSASRDRGVQSQTVPQPSAPLENRPPGFAASGAPSTARGWTEERVVVTGFVLLAFLAGLIIFVASFFDSLT